MVGAGLYVRQRTTWIVCVKVGSPINSQVYFLQGSASKHLPVLGGGVFDISYWILSWFID